MRFKKIVTMLLVATMAVTSINNINVFAKTNEIQAQSGIQIREAVPIQINERLQSTAISTLKKYTTASEAADTARTKLVNHESSVSVNIKSTSSDPVKVFDEFEDELLKETDNAYEGDYMHWDIDREYPSYVYRAVKTNKSIYYYYDFKIEYWYFTTLEQKKQVDDKVKEIITSFNFTTETTEYEKIKAIYDYVCSNVKYAEDINNDISYTAWSALFNNEAVCQGYSQLMYRILKEVGISARLIPGYGKNQNVMHGWNIVKLGNYYYNIDSTWDAEYAAAGKSYGFFLKGDNFQYHTRLDDYKTAEFYAEYPMAKNDYGNGTPTLSVASQTSKFSVIKPKFKSVSRKKIKLIKVAGAKKYQIRYTTNKKFKKEIKSITTKKITYKLKKIKKNKAYYVKFRAYTYINGKKIYTQWSKIKKINKK